MPPLALGAYLFLESEMQRYAIFIDAGYLLAQAVHILSGGATKKRAGLEIHNPEGLIEEIKSEAARHLDLTNKELLRIYWYDGVGQTGRTREHKAITRLPDMQFRAGTINSSGQQKGVDTLLVIDLIELSTNHAISDAVIIASDGDFAAGIELAQRRGVRIAVLGIEDSASSLRHNQSTEVLERADRRGVATKLLVEPYCCYTSDEVAHHPVALPIEACHAVLQTPLVEEINRAVARFVVDKTPGNSAVDRQTGTVESDVDRELIFAVYQAVGRKLTPDEKKAARKELCAQMSARTGMP